MTANRFFDILALVGIGWTLVVHVDSVYGQCEANECAKLLASDGASGDLFGRSVAISGDTAVIGADRHDHCAPDAGAAYVFRYDGSSWVQEAELLASDRTAGDFFGSSTAVEGNIAVIGAQRDEGNTGSAYVFRRHDNGTPGDPSDDFWDEEAKLLGSDGAAGDEFGRTVAITGDTIVIGTARDDTNTGSAYVFSFDGTSWGDPVPGSDPPAFTERAKLTACDAEMGDLFAISVTISGDTMVIGAYGDDDNGGEAGAVYVFERGAGWTDGCTNQVAKLIASDGAPNDHFGWPVSISGDAIVIGAYVDDGATGSAYVFEKGAGWVNGSANQVAKLSASDREPGDMFGHGAAISGDIVIVGAFGDDSRSGAGYLFEKAAGGWGDMTETVKLTASDAAANHELGVAAISGDTAVVGAPADDNENGADAGAVYVFRGLSDCNGNGTLDICDIAEGFSEDLNGNGIPDECENEPPVITCSGPVVLWSPNHELVDVSSAFSVDDPNGDPVTLTFRVFSDEPETPETGDGTGRHAPDFKDEHDGGRGLLVRSERRGAEDGRYYIFVITADDGNGGVTTGVCVAAVVPHDQNQQSLDDVIVQAEAAALVVQDALDSGGALPPPGFHEHGLAEPLGPKQ